MQGRQSGYRHWGGLSLQPCSLSHGEGAAGQSSAGRDCVERPWDGSPQGPGGIGQGSSDSHQNCPHCFLHSVGRVPGRGAQWGAAELSEHQKCGGWPGAFGVVSRKKAWSALGEGPLPAECGPEEKGNSEKLGALGTGAVRAGQSDKRCLALPCAGCTIRLRRNHY